MYYYLKQDNYIHFIFVAAFKKDDLFFIHSYRAKKDINLHYFYYFAFNYEFNHIEH